MALTSGAAAQNYQINRTLYRRSAETFLLSSTFIQDQTNQTLPSSGSFVDDLTLYSMASAAGTAGGIQRYLGRGDALAAGMFFYEFRNSNLNSADKEKLFMLDALATTARNRTKMDQSAYELNALATVMGAFYAWNLVDVALYSSDGIGGSISLQVMPGQYGFVYGARF